jgi:hypothetical protein
MGIPASGAFGVSAVIFAGGVAGAIVGGSIRAKHHGLGTSLLWGGIAAALIGPPLVLEYAGLSNAETLGANAPSSASSLIPVQGLPRLLPGGPF